MGARCRQAGRCEDPVDFGKGPAADERDRSSESFLCRQDSAHQVVVGHDIGRVIDDVEKRAVDVEKQR